MIWVRGSARPGERRRTRRRRHRAVLFRERKGRRWAAFLCPRFGGGRFNAHTAQWPATTLARTHAPEAGVESATAPPPDHCMASVIERQLRAPRRITRDHAPSARAHTRTHVTRREKSRSGSTCSREHPPASPRRRSWQQVNVAKRAAGHFNANEALSNTASKDGRIIGHKAIVLGYKQF